ncbi:hypothetical protein QWY85_04715 [Neolewinella lacunae]|uniref:Uncharacterized protein n=1 Tax=Neolewinella lacunae TaxID=1517758 RepID=A0A923PSQ4_9BACT|nr:hypothetical protein [Neolewinella lacunae]MBC6996097.1 hypothetical protein [Neolewinella lacunae]MDN3633950.1 hypothetical protein [Neolewinella lacunae]
MPPFTKIIIFSLFIFLNWGCEKAEPFTRNDAVHRGEALASSGEMLEFVPMQFLATPSLRTGFHRISGISVPLNLPNKPELIVDMNILDLSIGCKELNHAPAFPTSPITYPHARVDQSIDDQSLTPYVLREDRESWVCIDTITEGGRQLEGTFELHLYREEATFPGFESGWPRELSLLEGRFTAYGVIGGQ